MFEVDGHEITVVWNNVVLTTEFATMSQGDFNWSMVVGLLRRASD